MSGFDNDLSSMSMMDLFRQEAESHCGVLSANLLELEKNTYDKKLLENLMRAAHSIKGAARIMGLESIVGLAHSMEEVFVAAQEGRIVLDRDHIDKLFNGIDLFAAIGGQPDDQLEVWFTKQESTIKDLAQLYREISTGNENFRTTTTGEKQSVQQQSASHGTNSEQAHTEKIPDRSMRVSAEGMNRLMGYAGEVQVESRWLPYFSEKLLRLKFGQDEVHRLLAHCVEAFASDPVIVKNEPNLRKLFEKMDECHFQLGGILQEVEDHSRRSTEISHHLYTEILANRMRPFADGVSGFPRMVRDLARELGKDVTFTIIGEETLVDRDILDKIEAPLNHLIRNAVDHGIETPSERLESGKPETAAVSLEAKHSAGMLNIIVSDDGRGIDIEKLRDTVVTKKMVSREMAQQLREMELLEFLFLPNFSTRDLVNQVSGRGVGLDVVHNAVHEVHGTVRTFTRFGSGTTFELQLPLTLSVMRALLVEIADELYAFPLAAIDHVVRLEESDIKEIEGRQYISFDKERVGLVFASQVLEKQGKKDLRNDLDGLLVLVLSNRYNRYGLLIDRFVKIQDLVVQPLDPRLNKVQDISSVAILEDGTPVLILDVEDLVRTVDSLISGNRLQRIDHGEYFIEPMVKRILVVDDSITVREVERKMLSVKGYEVTTAVDGLDGWNILRGEVFDLVITDVDMPRLNGIELVHRIRQEEKYSTLPVIIVSYKDREVDRNRGLEAGADYYLTKESFQDEALIRAVEELIGSPSRG